MRSTQSSIASRYNLLSPPDLDSRNRELSSEGTASDITVRPKRHGIITPRISDQPNNAFKSPSSAGTTLNGTSSLNLNSPESQSSADQTDPSPPMSVLLEMSMALYIDMNNFSSQMRDMLGGTRWGLKRRMSAIPRELLGLMENVDLARRRHHERYKYLTELGRRDRSTLDYAEILRNAEAVSRSDALALGLFTLGLKKYMTDFMARDSTESGGRAVYMKLLQISQSLKMTVHYANYLRQHPERLFDPHPIPQRMSNGNRQIAKPIVPGPATNSPRTNLSYSSNPPSRLGWNNDPGPSSTYTQDMSSDDFLFENIFNFLNTVGNRCNEGLSKIYERLDIERQALEKSYGDNNQVGALTMLITRLADLIHSVTAMAQQLRQVAMRPELRDSSNFWVVVQKPLRVSLCPNPTWSPIHVDPTCEHPHPSLTFRNLISCHYILISQ
jgi:hypothetical protein